jgi:hypothetical protein
MVLILLFFSNQAYGADLFESIGIKPVYNKVYPPELQGIDSFEPEVYLLSVGLGQLTRYQFNVLHSYFERQSQVTFSAARSYTLEDFLPPAMQALLNKNYEVKVHMSFDEMNNISHEKFGGEPLKIMYFEREGIASATNCIGTVMEMIRVIRTQTGRGKYWFYYSGRMDASHVLSNSENARVVNSKDVQFGDYVTFEKETHVGTKIEHAAIALTPELYFEKRDVQEREPYRLVFLKDMKRRIRVNGIKVAYSRFKNSALGLLNPRNDLQTIYQEPEDRAEYEILPAWLRRAKISVQGDEPGSGTGLLHRVVYYDSTEIGIDPKTGRGRVESPSLLRPISIRVPAPMRCPMLLKRVRDL